MRQEKKQKPEHIESRASPFEKRRVLVAGDHSARTLRIALLVANSVQSEADAAPLQRELRRPNDEVVIDEGKGTVVWAGVPLPIRRTRLEFALLCRLAQARGNLVERSDLVRALGLHAGDVDHAVRNVKYRLARAVSTAMHAAGRPEMPFVIDCGGAYRLVPAVTIVEAVRDDGRPTED